MPKPRVLLVPMLLSACVLPAARSFAAEGCTPGGTPAPPGAGMRLGVPPACGGVGDLDGDGGPDTLWVRQFRDGNGRTDRVVGITTASGANSDMQVLSASPMPLVALAIDAQNGGGNQIIVSDGRSDLGPPSSGRHLVGLQALENNGQWTVRRTEIDLNGTLATIGQSDTVTASSAQDPVVTSAETISCGDLIIGKDGVQQP